MKIKKNKRILIVMLTGFLIGVMTVAASGGAVSAPAGTHLMVK